jgi:hypothetical protein
MTGWGADACSRLCNRHVASERPSPAGVKRIAVDKHWTRSLRSRSGCRFGFLDRDAPPPWAPAAIAVVFWLQVSSISLVKGADEQRHGGAIVDGSDAGAASWAESAARDVGGSPCRGPSTCSRPRHCLAIELNPCLRQGAAVPLAHLAGTGVRLSRRSTGFEPDGATKATSLVHCGAARRGSGSAAASWHRNLIPDPTSVVSTGNRTGCRAGPLAPGQPLRYSPLAICSLPKEHAP